MSTKKKYLNNKVTLLNMISSLLLQIVTIISGFIIPKIILSYFGSNINGLVSSINQFLSYITLLEGGISGIITANLYKPLIENDQNKINQIIKTANSFYKKIGFIFICYTIILAIFYPILFKSTYSYMFIFTLVIVLAINLFVQYMFSLTLRALLTADKKIYIISNVQIIIVILNVFLTIISVKIYPNIHILKLISGSLYFLQPIVFGIYIKKNYNLNLSVEKDNNLLKQRWNGFAVNVASFIHNCTDITILTIFTNLETVSICSIYTLVTNGIKTLITSVTNGINPTLGQSYARGDYNEINEKINLYEYIMNLLVFYLFSITGLLITPFVLIYTSGINDANYNQQLFGILLVISEAIYLLKFPHLNLAYTANKFKEITVPSFIEAILNIIVSLLLVKRWGLIGVSIGTIVAMLYRMIFHIYFTKKIIGRKQSYFYSKIIIFSLTSLIGIIICILVISPIKLNILSWIIHALLYSIIMGIMYLIMSILFYKKELNFFIKYLKH